MGQRSSPVDMFRIRAWLEQTERETNKLPRLPNHQLLPSEIVQEAVDRVERKVQMERNKPKRLNIMELPDDNYDFSTNPKQPVQSKSSKLTNQKMKRKAKPKVPKPEIVMDSFEYQRRFFELDDYVHAADSSPGSYKSHELKISKAISRIQPPAQGPPKSKSKTDKSKKASSFWNLVKTHEARVLYEKNKDKHGGAQTVKKSSINKFNKLVSKRRTKTVVQPRHTLTTPPDQRHVEFAFTKSKMNVYDNVKIKPIISKRNEKLESALLEKSIRDRGVRKSTKKAIAINEVATRVMQKQNLQVEPDSEFLSALKKELKSAPSNAINKVKKAQPAPEKVKVVVVKTENSNSSMAKIQARLESIQRNEKAYQRSRK